MEYKKGMCSFWVPVSENNQEMINQIFLMIKM